MSVINLFRLFLHAPRYAKQSEKAGDKRPIGTICKDIVSLHIKYGINPSKYVENKIGILSKEDRNLLLQQCSEQKRQLQKYNENRRFLAKYSGIEWEKSRKKRKRRKDAYIKHYHMGKHCQVQYGVTLIAEHLHEGKLTIGDNILFGRDCDIDYTGDLTIGNGVSFAEGCKVLTHDHDFFGLFNENELIRNATHRAHNTPLIIKDNVLIGARSLIMPSVTEIGENAIISAGSVVTKPIPANCIVSGNPAQVVGKISPKARIYYRYNKESK